MSDDKQPGVDAVIDQVVADQDGGLSSIKETLGKAQKALDGARTTMQSAYGKAVERSHEATERTRIHLEDAKRHLAEAKVKMNSMAAKTKEQAEVLYNKTTEQYEQLAEKSRELYTRVRDRVADIDFKEKGDQVLDYIRENPGKAVLIALATGFLVGYVTRPRD